MFYSERYRTFMVSEEDFKKRHWSSTVSLASWPVITIVLFWFYNNLTKNVTLLSCNTQRNWSNARHVTPSIFTCSLEFYSEVCLECSHYFLEISCIVRTTIVNKIAIRVPIDNFNVVLLEITLKQYLAMILNQSRYGPIIIKCRLCSIYEILVHIGLYILPNITYLLLNHINIQRWYMFVTNTCKASL